VANGHDSFNCNTPLEVLTPQNLHHLSQVFRVKTVPASARGPRRA
jgi:hypothetical protein